MYASSNAADSSFPSRSFITPRGKNWPLSGKEKFEFEHGNLEIDIHKDGKRYLTGFVIDPRKFIVDYIKTR